ncbi:nucleotidyltransferase domain-containing protein [Streptococcus cuniculi]|nr:nucleotidyltransferase domain-containing protein [Streptococcus cuniculi]
MMMEMDSRIIQVLNRIKHEWVAQIGSNLVGIYVHGSLAYGCFSWEQSDIDVLMVVKESLQQAEKEKLICSILEIERLAPQKGIEMSVVCKKDLKPPCFPMPYQLHYSMQHRKAAGENISLYCANMQGEDMDLTAHIMVICQKGIVLYGEAIPKVFQEPTRKDYLGSVWYDIEDSLTMVIQDPVSTILNLCRTLAYVKEEMILSKKEGGEWGQEHLSQRYYQMLESVLSAYRTGVALVPTSLMAQFVEECLAELAGDIV